MATLVGARPAVKIRHACTCLRAARRAELAVLRAAVWLVVAVSLTTRSRRHIYHVRFGALTVMNLTLDAFHAKITGRRAIRLLTQLRSGFHSM